MQKLLNVAEIAAFLGVEKTTIYSWTLVKKCIPHIKISEKCIKFDMDQIKEWLAEKQFNPAEPVKEPSAGKKRGRGRPKDQKKHGASLVELAKKDLQG